MHLHINLLPTDHSIDHVPAYIVYTWVHFLNSSHTRIEMERGREKVYTVSAALFAVIFGRVLANVNGSGTRSVSLCRL